MSGEAAICPKSLAASQPIAFSAPKPLVTSSNLVSSTELKRKLAIVKSLQAHVSSVNLEWMGFHSLATFTVANFRYQLS